MSDSETEAMIKAAGADHFPRVSEQSIKDKIQAELYSRFKNVGLTVCILQVKNGFTFVGTSACASPENYNQEIGDKIAYGNAFKQIWAAEGYLLKEKLAIAKEGLNIETNDELSEGDLQAELGQPAA